MNQQILEHRYEELQKIAGYNENPLFIDWKKEVADEQNLIILINGPTRSGKSSVALTICEAMDPAFQDISIVPKRFVFSAKEFMTAISSGDLKPGSVVVWEEVGTSGSLRSKNWYSEINKIITDVLQIYGHKSLILILTTPVKRYLDKDARVLTNEYLETSRGGLDLIGKVNVCIVQKTFTSSKYDKTYFINHVYNGNKVMSWVFNYPYTPGIVEIYEKHSRQRKVMMESVSEQKIEHHEKLESQEHITSDYIVKEVFSKPEVFIKTFSNKQMLDMDVASAQFGVSKGHAELQEARSIINVKLRAEPVAVTNTPPKPPQEPKKPVGRPSSKDELLRVITEHILSNKESLEKYTETYKDGTRLRLNKGLISKDFEHVDPITIIKIRQIVEHAWKNKKYPKEEKTTKEIAKEFEELDENGPTDTKS